jgi:hypothetical protein
MPSMSKDLAVRVASSLVSLISEVGEVSMSGLRPGVTGGGCFSLRSPETKFP